MADDGDRNEQMRQLAAQLAEAWNSHDPKCVAALCAADYEGENVGEAAPHRGPGGMAASVAAYLAAFPDLRFTIDEVVIQDDRVAQVWHAHATHRGPNIPGTGRRIAVRGASLPQLTAFFTNATILASSAAVNAFSAKAVGHMLPSSRCAVSLKPKVA